MFVRAAATEPGPEVRASSMSGDDWLPFVYRDFYDVPHGIVVEWRGQFYLLESLFDDQLDDFEPRYSVYMIPREAAQNVEGASWVGLHQLGEWVGAVDVAAVEFDPTKRKMLNAAVFDHLSTQ
jgi:hypothetical protein